ncbi:NADH:flavin oxidoreductases, Old Yellow Enzyme family [Richelia intracellularis]|nr:NADH:flavin oxidoreductases, Old Yellow Enzyme family [Richelia intracellularis]
MGNQKEKLGVAESGDEFTKFSKIYQWFQRLIHPLIQQRQKRAWT